LTFSKKKLIIGFTNSLEDLRCEGMEEDGSVGKNIETFVRRVVMGVR
jgi:hypothetical protein